MKIIKNTSVKYPVNKVIKALCIFVIIVINSCSSLSENEKEYIFSEDFDKQESVSLWKINNPQLANNFIIDKGKGIDGSDCYQIHNDEKGELYISTEVNNLTPGTLYRMRASIKTENVEEGRGAIITVNMENSDQIWNASKHLYGSNNWQEVYIDFIANETGKAELCCRLGFFGGTTNGGNAKGKAWFDNIYLEKTPSDEISIFEGSHIRLMLDSDKKSISDEEVKSWVSQLDKVYESYQKFVRDVPYKGRKIDILTTPGIESGYWALAGNPILWNNNTNIKQYLVDYKEKDDWSFGILHEIAHTFSVGTVKGCDYWNWNDEIFANFRMAYALEDCSGSVSQRNVIYTGKDIINYYKIFYDETLGQSIASDNGDAIQYTMMRIKEKYGWQVYEKAFVKLYDCSNKPEQELKNRFQKFLYLMKHLSDEVGEDITKTCYTEEEMKLLKEALDK